MLPIAVIVLAMIYLVLHYAGVFEEIAGNSGGSRASSARRSGEPKGKQDRRLIVFEEFFKGDREEE